MTTEDALQGDSSANVRIDSEAEIAVRAGKGGCLEPGYPLRPDGAVSTALTTPQREYNAPPRVQLKTLWTVFCCVRCVGHQRVPARSESEV